MMSELKTPYLREINQAKSKFMQKVDLYDQEFSEKKEENFKKEVTGDKTAKDVVKEDGSNIIQIKRLAGL